PLTVERRLLGHVFRFLTDAVLGTPRRYRVRGERSSGATAHPPRFTEDRQSGGPSGSVSAVVAGAADQHVRLGGRGGQFLEVENAHFSPSVLVVMCGREAECAMGPWGTPPAWAGSFMGCSERAPEGGRNQ